MSSSASGSRQSKINDLFPLHFEPLKSKEFDRGLSVDDTRPLPELTNHYLNPSELPPRDPSHELTIVWDLDQTLISADGFNGEDPEHPETKLIVRPYARLVLNILRRNPKVEFIVWTAGIKSHAKRVVKSFGDEYFDYVISRSKWSAPIKDLNLLVSTGRTLDSMILIDDRMDVGEPHPENLLVVPGYFPRDNPEEKTMPYLANIIYRAINLYLANEKSIPLRTFLYGPLTQKCIYKRHYYYGIMGFKNKEELMARIDMFQVI